ncbi:hypothetical protein TWF694_002805 [Orbilia ellipsospora]|uniref:Diaminohydroxyphosphoribosylamino-pyrimidine deaminase n=1 Tax=Orbilia ellipsospora TaxID=2528407 RepID=A0AAV9X0T7_9PEZI
MTGLISLLQDEEIQDPDEECFILFSSKPDNRDLGFVSRTDSTVSVTINSHDFTIHQAPSLLTSTRETGTTGAVLWKVTPLLAAWMTHPSNIVTKHILKNTSTVVELGAGTSGVLALSFSSFVSKYFATDQDYCLKLLRKNLSENSSSSEVSTQSKGRPSASKRSKRTTETSQAREKITILPLDWQLTEVSSIPDLKDKIINLIIAADCIYNESLVDPLVDTMVDLSKLNKDESDKDHESDTLVLIAQELRSPDVLEAFLKAFHAKFRVWRLPDKLFKDCGDGGRGLLEGSGYVVHIGILR